MKLTTWNIYVHENGSVKYSPTWNGRVQGFELTWCQFFHILLSQKFRYFMSVKHVRFFENVQKLVRVLLLQGLFLIRAQQYLCTYSTSTHLVFWRVVCFFLWFSCVNITVCISLSSVMKSSFVMFKIMTYLYWSSIRLQKFRIVVVNLFYPWARPTNILIVYIIKCTSKMNIIFNRLPILIFHFKNIKSSDYVTFKIA